MAGIPLGRFCWYELLTTDPDAAPDFYGPVAGWSTAPWAGGGGHPYTMWMNGETSIGGIMQLPDEAVAGGTTPHWLAHVSTPDLGATMAKARELGGEVMTHMEMPEVGDFAIIRDPQGAIVSAYQPAGDAPGHDGPPAIGEVSWNELATDGWSDAWSFYSQLFGWETTREMDMGDLGTYHMFGDGKRELGGMFDKPVEMPASAWLFYVRVPAVDAALEKVTELGGAVLNGPMEVPDGDVVAQCLDPQGAPFAVHATAGS